MHEAAFAECACPPRHVSLNLPLLDFSIGHRLLLLRQRNPLLWLPEADFNALPFEEQISWLIEAVFICSKSHRAHQLLERPSRFNWRIKWNWLQTKFWHWRRNFSFFIFNSPLDYWPLEIAGFRNYIAAAKIATEWKERRTGFPFVPCLPSRTSEGRSLGGPYDCSLIQFLLKTGLCRHEIEALEYPYAAAQIHYLVHLEREGALEIMNFEQVDFQEWCDTENAKKSEATQDASAQAKSPPILHSSFFIHPSSGLATPIPPELKGSK